MSDPVIDCITWLLWQIPEMPVPSFMCLWRTDGNVGCDCDGYDHSVEWLIDDGGDEPLLVTVPTTHRGAPYMSYRRNGRTLTLLGE